MPSSNVSDQTWLFSYFCKAEDEYVCRKKEAGIEKEKVFGLNLVSSLSRRERSQLKLCPRTDRSSHVILAVNSSIYLEVKDILSLLLTCTCRD